MTVKSRDLTILQFPLSSRINSAEGDRNSELAELQSSFQVGMRAHSSHRTPDSTNANKVPLDIPIFRR